MHAKGPWSRLLGMGVLSIMHRIAHCPFIHPALYGSVQFFVAVCGSRLPYQLSDFKHLTLAWHLTCFICLDLAHNLQCMVSPQSKQAKFTDLAMMLTAFPLHLIINLSAWWSATLEDNLNTQA